MISRDEISFQLSDIHIVGFSLGAQVAGKIGVDLNGNLARITGLDPAGFEKWEFISKFNMQSFILFKIITSNIDFLNYEI